MVRDRGHFLSCAILAVALGSAARAHQGNQPPAGADPSTLFSSMHSGYGFANVDSEAERDSRVDFPCDRGSVRAYLLNAGCNPPGSDATNSDLVSFIHSTAGPLVLQRLREQVFEHLYLQAASAG